MKCKSNNLTDKQEKFVQELIKGKSQREAYMIAYPKSKKWKDYSIDIAASKMFANDKVKLRYESIRTKVIDKAEKKAIVTAEQVLLELTKIGMANITDYLEYKTVKSKIADDEDGEPVIDYRPIISLFDSTEVDTSAIQEVSISKDGTFKFKLYDKQKALEMLGRHLKLFDKEEEDNKTINVIHTIPRPPKEEE